MATGQEHLGISRSPEDVLEIEINKERKPVAVPTPSQPLNNKPTSEADTYRNKRLRQDGKDSVADLLDPQEVTEDMQAWIDAHPNWPGMKNYDLRKAMEEGAVSLGVKTKPTTMSDMVAGKEPEPAGGMNFLPEEYYRSNRTFSYFNYDADSDTYQYTNAPDRVAAYAVKGFGQSLAETLYVDPLAEPMTQIEQQAMQGDGETIPEIVGYDKFGAEIWMDVPANPVQVSPEQIESTSQALRQYTMPESIANLDLDDSDDAWGMVEGGVGVLAEMVLDIWGAGKLTGGNIFKREKAVEWYRKAVNRFKDVADPRVITGEFLFAKSPNPANKGTALSMLAEMLEEELGMEGEIIELMKSLDDNALSQALAITLEAYLLLEVGRGTALGGYKVTGMKWLVKRAADEMAKAEKILDAMNVSMAGGPSKLSQPRAAVPKGEPISISRQSLEATVEPNLNNKPYEYAKTGPSHPISEIMLPQTLAGMEQGIKRVSIGKAISRRIITPSDMQGGWFLGSPGDRTLADAWIVGVDGKPLTNRVKAEGGMDYMLTHDADNYMWASGKAVISGLSNAVKRGNGDPVYFGYLPMNFDGLDYSTMPFEVHLDRIKSAKIPAKNIKQFNEMFKQKDAFNIPGFKSINNQKTIDLLMSNGEYRKRFIRRSDKSDAIALGMPDVATTRLAVTEPSLMNVKTGSGGSSIALADPTGLITSVPKSAHKSYSHQLGGNYFGAFNSPVPLEILYRDYYQQLLGMGKTPAQIWRSIGMKKPLQRTDQQWVDEVSQYLQGQNQ